jgi:NAD(P)-dependent dehydrogenase (short-subunit alcohol dehydrogenase family)/rhamnose utilization protein RhaD (predicted bifunctional aldolase and dehydrogenase)
MSSIRDDIAKLVEISRYYGSKKEYVIAGGGNTSFKTSDQLWVKASGTTLATISEEGFAVLDRSKLSEISRKEYGTEPFERERRIGADLMASLSDPACGLRPSVEASLHDLLPFKFVVHTHPTIFNAILCSNSGQAILSGLLPADEFIFISYTDPGYVLFKKVTVELQAHIAKFGKAPHILMLQNHGVFVGADTPEEIRKTYADLEAKILPLIRNRDDVVPTPIDPKMAEVIPAVRMMLSRETLKVARLRKNSLIDRYTVSQSDYRKISLPFTPDNIVYCKAHSLFVDSDGSAQEMVEEFRKSLELFRKQHPYDPKMILFRNNGLLAVEDSSATVEILLDVFEDLIRISHFSENFGGPRFMSEKEISFIDTWEAENYRRKVSTAAGEGRLARKSVIITGAGQGFGLGIAEGLMTEKANLVVADINEEAGENAVKRLNSLGAKNSALFVKTDVSSLDSVTELVRRAVFHFGGVDLFISNAGILKAGGLEEMTPENFERVTKVNYSAYFFCVKAASVIMKIQSRYKPGYLMDIIQINSKSGLRGSNRNFAYAGGKFGGIGLTQSFALELMPEGIKVNAICPGNFFEGPLWSDPDNGLFIQYLKAGKVPGAKTIEDVKRHYERQVPAGRGCLPSDVVKAVLYAVEQTYETGQAIPVTGGQVMLSS